MYSAKTYDLAVIGGGLAGLALAIKMAEAGYSTVLFEKETYPFHKVCGEYISMESWPFLQSLGIDPEALKLPRINKLNISDCNGKITGQPLEPGGYGISRYKLDMLLAQKAKSVGVELMENCKAEDIKKKDLFEIQTDAGLYKSSLVAGTWGKRSNLDRKLNRSFFDRRTTYVGVKYHIAYPVEEDTITLHNFPNGYCGISRVEDGISCLCYLATSTDLKKHGSIAGMEEKLLSTNPRLREIFTGASFLFDKPLSISQISFEKKEQVVDGIFFAGDAAGMITPLCGNGMSMALHAAKLLSEHFEKYYTENLSLEQLEKHYTREWQKLFGVRLKAGRSLQYFFGNPGLTNSFLSVLRPFPALRKKIVGLTHGEGF